MKRSKKRRRILAALRRNGISGFRNLLYSNELQGRAIMDSFTVEPEYREKLELLIEGGKYRNCTIIRILKNPIVLNAIDRIGIEKFSLLLDRDGFEIEVTGSDRNWTFMVHNMLQDRPFLDAVNRISVEKLLVLFGTNVTKDSRIITYFSIETVINSIIELDIKQFTVLLQAKSYSIINVMGLLWCHSIIALNLISAEKVKMLIEYYGSHLNEVLIMIRNPFLVNFFHVVDMKKLSVLLEYFGSQYHGLTFFGSKACARSFNGISDEKLIFLLGCNFFRRFYHRFLAFVNDERLLGLVNSLTLDELTVIFTVTSINNLLEIFESTGFDIRKNLSFAVALYKRGRISNITFECVSNEAFLYEKVITVFPNSFPARRILERPANIESNPKLQDRCIAVYIEHF